MSIWHFLFFCLYHSPQKRRVGSVDHSHGLTYYQNAKNATIYRITDFFSQKLNYLTYLTRWIARPACTVPGRPSAGGWDRSWPSRRTTSQIKKQIILLVHFLVLCMWECLVVPSRRWPPAWPSSKRTSWLSRGRSSQSTRQPPSGPGVYHFLKLFFCFNNLILNSTSLSHRLSHSSSVFTSDMTEYSPFFLDILNFVFLRAGKWKQRNKLWKLYFLRCGVSSSAEKTELITRQLQHIFIQLLLYISLGIVAIQVSWLSRLSSTFVLHQVFFPFPFPSAATAAQYLAFFHSSVGAFVGWRGPPPPPPPWYFRTLALLYTKGGRTDPTTEQPKGAATTLYFPSLQLFPLLLLLLLLLVLGGEGKSNRREGRGRPPKKGEKASSRLASQGKKHAAKKT